MGPSSIRRELYRCLDCQIFETGALEKF